MAPEHPFPVPTNDCYVVTKYILESGDEIGDTNKVVLIGDSAGGNCVAVMTQRLNEENVKQPILQILIYPWVQMVLLFIIYKDKPSLPFYSYRSSYNILIRFFYLQIDIIRWAILLLRMIVGR